MTRVLLVDDDPTCVEGLKQILDLAQDLEVVGVAATEEEAYTISQQTAPEVVVIDADLPRASCLAAMARLTNGSSGVEQAPVFVCVAVYPDMHDAALQAGAIRFLRKDGSARELVEAVREAARIRRSRSSSQNLPPSA